MLIHLLRDQADVLVKIVRDAIKRVDGIEDNLLAGKLNHKRANLGALRRLLVRLQRLLAVSAVVCAPGPHAMRPERTH